jgi:hypothetical protein
MTPTNRTLLESQQALQDLVQTDLRGVHALHLMEILDPVQERLNRLQQVQQEVGSEEEMQEVLDETLEIDQDPLPKRAFEDAEVSAATLITLEWLID